VAVGDVDGDGELEVAFGTSAGGVHALRGPSGLDAPGFPFRTRGRIMAPVLLAPLVAGERRWWRASRACAWSCSRTTGTCTRSAARQARRKGPRSRSEQRARGAAVVPACRSPCIKA